MYCESCLREGLTTWVENKVGGVFCSEKCRKDFEEMMLVYKNGVKYKVI